MERSKHAEGGVKAKAKPRSLEQSSSTFGTGTERERERKSFFFSFSHNTVFYFWNNYRQMSFEFHTNTSPPRARYILWYKCHISWGKGDAFDIYHWQWWAMMWQLKDFNYSFTWSFLHCPNVFPFSTDLQSVLLVDGFHSVVLSLYIESSHICIPLRQQLFPSLSVANGFFLIESPQVVYLFVEVKRKQCEQDAGLGFFLLLSFQFCQQVIVCHLLSLSSFVPTARVLYHVVQLWCIFEAIYPQNPHHIIIRTVFW